MSIRILAAAALAGCSQSSEDASAPRTDAGHVDAAPLDADVSDVSPGDTDTTVPDADAGGSCDTNPTPLLVRDYSGSERYFVEVLHDGVPKALQLDTGSSLTFLFTGAGQPDYEPDIAVVQIGCEEVSVAGRGYDAQNATINGLEVVGLLGMDYLLDKPALLDVEDRLLTRYAVFPEGLTTDTAGAFGVGFDDVQGHGLFPVLLDETPVRLMFDTGGGDTLWVGVEGNPGDPVSYAQDFEGNTFPVYQGEGEFVMPGQPVRTIPVDRAPEFPYFDQTVEALGGNLHGLLGVTAFPGERLLFEGSASRLWVLPK